MKAKSQVNFFFVIKSKAEMLTLTFSELSSGNFKLDSKKELTLLKKSLRRNLWKLLLSNFWLGIKSIR